MTRQQWGRVLRKNHARASRRVFIKLSSRSQRALKSDYRTPDHLSHASSSSFYFSLSCSSLSQSFVCPVYDYQSFDLPPRRTNTADAKGRGRAAVTRLAIDSFVLLGPREPSGRIADATNIRGCRNLRSAAGLVSPRRVRIKFQTARRHFLEALDENSLDLRVEFSAPRPFDCHGCARFDGPGFDYIRAAYLLADVIAETGRTAGTSNPELDGSRWI